MMTTEALLIKVETDLPDEQLALIGCGFTTGFGAALNTAGIEPGSTVAVIGCGGVGQAAIQGARVAGAARIVAVDPVPLKRVTAERLGATHSVDPREGDPVEQVRHLTDGRGVDYALEAIGLSETIVQAYGMARRGGTVVIVGATRVGEEVTFSAFDLMKRLLGSVLGSSQVRRDVPRTVALADAGKIDLASMVSRTIGLDEVNDSMQAIDAGEVIRSVIRFS
jgi:S-(hydroxymethyl)glutathione dehydrogenase/alcohol dehydrogenase